MKTKYALIAALIAILTPIASHASGLEVIGFDTTAGFHFQGATASNYFSLEYSQTVDGPWTNWGAVSQQPITGYVMGVDIPLFFRIKEIAPDSFPQYATGTPLYVESDPIWQSDSNTVWDAINTKQPAGNYATGTPVYVESNPSLGTWQTKTVDVVHYATNDGFVVWTQISPACASDLNAWIYSDSSSNPTTIRAQLLKPTTSGSALNASLMTPVRAGDYYRARYSSVFNECNVTTRGVLYYIPLSE